MNKAPPRMLMHTVVHGSLAFVPGWLAYIFLDGVDTFALSPSWNAFARIITEAHLGYVCLGFFTFGMVSLPFRDWRLKAFAAFVLSVFHLFFAITFKSGGVQSGTAPGVYATFAFLGLALAYSTAHIGQRATVGLVATDLPR